VPGFVCEGLTLLAGPPKTGKTWLAPDFVSAVARGGLALGSVACEQGHVNYFDGENGQRRIDARFDVVAADGNWRPDSDHVWLSAAAPAK
jgi:RecA-family ATPase